MSKKAKPIPRPEIENLAWAEADAEGVADETIRREIFRATTYRLHDFYMPPVALARLYRLLGGDYGKSSLVLLLAGASRPQLISALAFAREFLEFIREHPLAVCPCCGSTVEKKLIRETPSA
jgi:hypothetical protein